MGKPVRILYDPSLSPADDDTASQAITNAAELLNKNTDKFTDDEKRAIAQISSFKVAPAGSQIGATGNGGITLSTRYIDDISTAVLASTFAHEGQHYLNSGEYPRGDAWMDEQSATRMQLQIGGKIGFTPNETDSFRRWSDRSNRDEMQKHMINGYKY